MNHLISKTLYEEACILKATECSLYLSNLIGQNSTIHSRLIQGLHIPYSLEEMRNFIKDKQCNDERSVKSLLRLLRKDVLSRLIVRDINLLADLEEVMQTTTALAEICISVAAKFSHEILSKEYGFPVAKSIEGRLVQQEIIIIGMGKLGGCELNVSSDIDLIFAYDEEGETNGRVVISNQEYFSHMVKKIITIIDEVTADGFVFRVDIRLRPFGTEGVIVSSLNALESYYQQFGREWERYAWIKGRVIFGNGNKLQKMLRPFIYRKYLDFGVISSLRSLKDQIKAEVSRKDMHNNIKLGRGGIREIEFIAQVFQLIRGGKDPALQLRSTLETLDLLASRNIIPDEVMKSLKSSYIFLRNLEHRLQYYDDQQTHELPKESKHQACIAKAMNFRSWSELENQIKLHRNNVERQFEDVFTTKISFSDDDNNLISLWRGGSDLQESLNTISRLGYKNPSEVTRKITFFSHSQRVKKLPDESRNRLDSIVPFIIDNCAKFYNSDETLYRSLDLIDKVCQRASYLAFFNEFPNALYQVVSLVSASPWLSDYISQHPVLLDSLYFFDDHDVFDVDVQKNKLIEKLSLFADDTEQQMNILREEQHKHLFSIACKDVFGKVSPEEVSASLGNLAKMILDVVQQTVWQTMSVRHTSTPQFAIIAYGKFGSNELGYSSDLDLVFLYDDDHPDARDTYLKFGLRIISWLNTFTSSGILYEIDTQLRPDGNSGLLVSSTEGFQKYQFEKAWVWELQAITRAKFVAGDPNVGRKFEKIREEVLSLQRDNITLKDQIKSMRDRMKASYKFTTGQFDLKQGLGGMIDIEFIVQYLILAHAYQFPSLLLHQDMTDILEQCGQLGLIEARIAKNVAKAYRKFKKNQHAMRLQGYTSTWIPEQLVKNEVNLVRKLWHEIFNHP